MRKNPVSTEPGAVHLFQEFLDRSEWELLRIRSLTAQLSREADCMEGACADDAPMWADELAELLRRANGL